MKLKQLITRIGLNRKEEFPFPEDLEAYLEDFVPNTLLKSETLQKAFEVSNYDMEAVYTEAHAFYMKDNYLESATAFRFLVLLNPFVAKYWLGLGASLQLLQKYTKALHSYAIVALLEIKNPYPHFHAFECYLGLGDQQEAQKALEDAYKRATENPEYREFKEMIEKEHPHVLRNTNNCHTHRTQPVCSR